MLLSMYVMLLSWYGALCFEWLHSFAVSFLVGYIVYSLCYHYTHFEYFCQQVLKNIFEDFIIALLPFIIACGMIPMVVEYAMLHGLKGAYKKVLCQKEIK